MADLELSTGLGPNTAQKVIPYTGVGMAAADYSPLFVPSEELISGVEPHYGAFENFPIKANAAALLAFTPVVVGADGYLIPAVQGTPAMGITTAPTVVSTSDQSIAIARAGVFNPAALAYDASFTTDAQKIAAFRGAPAPTNIQVRPRR